MKLIYKCLGGSHLYGLNVPESDLDWRGVFLNDSIGTIVGLDRHEHQDLRHESKDEFYFEIRHFLNSLRKTNTQAIELLFNDGACESIDPIFKKIQDNKYRLLDSKKLYKSLKGYLYGELKLATGERSGDIGSKRRGQIEKYGFSPKNFMNMIRLCYCGQEFFKTGVYPVKVSDNEELKQLLMEIRLQPEKFTMDRLTLLYNFYELGLNESYDSRLTDYEFDTDLANEIVLEAYLPILEKLKKQ